MKITSLTIESEVSRSHAFQTARERISATIEISEEEARDKDKLSSIHNRMSDFLHSLVAVKAEVHLYELLNPNEKD